MQVEKRWQSILAAAVDGAVVEPGARGPRPDVVVRTRAGRAVALEIKWAGEGWPQDVRRAARDIGEPWPADVVLLARHLSPGAVAWLRELGANWADETGQAHILGPDGLIVIRELAAPPRPDRAPKPFSWSPSAIHVAELILAREDAPLRATELAHRSHWSLPQVANVLKAFDGEGWTAKRGPARGRGAYRELIDADAMLGPWAAAVGAESRPARIAHRATRDVMTLLRDELAPVLDQGTNWAVSGWAGLELAAPFATTTPSLHVYVADSDFAGTLSNAIEKAGLREVDEGGRVTFWGTKPGLLDLAKQFDGVPVVSPARLFADLTSFGARGQDAADHVKNELIDPLHPERAAKGGRDG
jgi:hypothetical protein